MKKNMYVCFNYTLVLSTKRIVELYNDDYKYYDGYKYVQWTDVESYEMPNLSLADREDVMRYFRQPRYFSDLEFEYNAYEILFSLQDEFNVFVVSIDDSASLLGQKLWVERNLTFATFIGIDSSKYSDYSHIDMTNSYLIDCCAINLNGSNASNKILFGDMYECNTGYKGTRCYNWHDVRCHIKDSLNLKRKPLRFRTDKNGKRHKI